MWRWFFAVLFLAAVALNVATVTSSATFGNVSDLVGAILPDAGLVRDDLAAEVETERAARVAADAVAAQTLAALEATEAELADARSPEVVFRGEAMTADAMIATVLDGIERRTVEAAERRVAATAAQAVPVWGTAAIVEVSRLDLVEACETLRDLEAMRGALSLDPGTAGQVCDRETPTPATIWQTVQDDPAGAWQALRAQGVDLPDMRMPFWALAATERMRTRLGFEPGE